MWYVVEDPPRGMIEYPTNMHTFYVILLRYLEIYGNFNRNWLVFDFVVIMNLKPMPLSKLVHVLKQVSD